MLETIGPILLGLLCIVAVGGATVGYVAWRSRRAVQDQAAKMAARTGGTTSSGGKGEE